MQSRLNFGHLANLNRAFVDVGCGDQADEELWLPRGRTESLSFYPHFPNGSRGLAVLRTNIELGNRVR